MWMLIFQQQYYYYYYYFIMEEWTSMLFKSHENPKLIIIA